MLYSINSTGGGRVCRLLFTAILAVIISAPAGFGTSILVNTVKCPICGHDFAVREIASTNNIGGQDTDFFVRAVGVDAVLYYPWVCPRCLFAGYREDFADTLIYPDSVVTALREYLHRPTLADSSLSIDELPFWTGYDLILQTHFILGTDAWSRASTALEGSWTVRATASVYPHLPDDVTRAALARLSIAQKDFESDIVNKADRDVALGRSLLSGLDDVPDTSRLPTMLAAVWLLREHGENQEILDLLPLLAREIEVDVFVRFAEELGNDIELERYFQRIALPSFNLAVLDADLPADTRAIGLYLSGDLCRRLGRSNEAREYYAEAIKLISEEETMFELINRQLLLVE